MIIKKKRIPPSLIATYAVLLLLILFVLVPIIYIISVSFNSGASLYSEHLFTRNPTLDNYKKLLTETKFLQWTWNTVLAGILCSVITVALVAPTAYAFSRLRFKGRKNMLIVFLVLQMFPGMMAMVAYYLLLNMVGLLDTSLGLVLLYAGGAIPANTWLLKGYLDTIPRSLEESACIDGANKIQVLFRIIMPLAVPMLILVAVFGFAAPFGDYVLSRIVLTSPDNYTLALGTYNFIAAEYGKNFTMFAASSLLAATPITILYLCLQKVIFTGLKGAVVR